MYKKTTYLYLLAGILFCLGIQARAGYAPIVRVADGTCISEVLPADGQQTYDVPNTFNGILNEQSVSGSDISFQRVLSSSSKYAKLYVSYTEELKSKLWNFDGFIHHKYTEPTYCIAFRQIII